MPQLGARLEVAPLLWPTTAESPNCRAQSDETVAEVQQMDEEFFRPLAGFPAAACPSNTALRFALTLHPLVDVED